MANRAIQIKKAKQFHALHYANELLILPNIWDTMGAVMLEDIGHLAIATSSAAVALANGYTDGEKIPFEKVISNLAQIVNSVAIPVTADIECGYYTNQNQFKENIKQLIETGIVGLNFEDFSIQHQRLLTVEEQSNRIALIREIANDMGVPLFINARIDVYIHGENYPTAAAKYSETLKRALAYKSAGADCIFPILMKETQAIKNLIAQLKMPLNILATPNIPDIKTLKEIGVKRLSLGAGFLRVAIKAMKDFSLILKKQDNLSELYENEVTTDYLKEIVQKTV